MDVARCRLHAARAPPALAQRSHRRARRRRSARRCGPARRRARSLARRRVPGRRHRRSAAQRGFLPDVDHVGLERTRRSDVWNHFPSTPVDVVAERFGFEGPRACVVAACSSSTIAIGRAVEAIRSGRADAALAGGTDALARLTFSGFNLLRLMDAAPCRPFDRSRAGMNIGEGAGILVLENLEHARAPRRAHLRGARRPRRWRARRFIRRRPNPRAGRWRPSSTLALRDAGIDRRRSRSHQRARHRDAAERRRRGARVPARVRRPGQRASR